MRCSICDDKGTVKEAEFTTGGVSVCKDHKSTPTAEKFDTWLVYGLGLVCLLALWAVLFAGDHFGLFSPRVLINDRDRWFFLVGFAVPAVLFLVNLLWARKVEHGNYSQEVEAINHIERNSSWLLIAGGTVLGGGSLYFSNLNVSPAKDLELHVTSFVTFVVLSILFTIPVVLKYWTSYGDMSRIFTTRHAKTSFFAIGAGFLAAAAVALLLSLRSVSAGP